MTSPANEPPEEPLPRPSDSESSWVETWKAVVTEPEAFFSQAALDRGLEEPLRFAALNFAIGGLGAFVFGGGIVEFIGFFATAVLGLGIGTWLTMLVTRKLFDGTGDYEATFRMLAYATAPTVAIGVPVVKYLAAVYALYLGILAIARAQSIDKGQALLTIVATKIAAVFLAWGLGLAGAIVATSPLF